MVAVSGASADPGQAGGTDSVEVLLMQSEIGAAKTTAIPAVFPGAATGRAAYYAG